MHNDATTLVSVTRPYEPDVPTANLRLLVCMHESCLAKAEAAGYRRPGGSRGG